MLPIGIPAGPLRETHRGHEIRKIDTRGIITTVAGNGATSHTGDGGPATAASILFSSGLAIDHAGNLYVGEYSGDRVRRIGTDGIITTIAGTAASGHTGDGGPATACTFNIILNVATDASDNVYVVEQGDIRKVSPDGIVTLCAGNRFASTYEDNIPATDAYLSTPTGVYVDNAGSIYITQSGESAVRYIRNTEAVNNVNAPQFTATIFPNPSNGQFVVRIEAALSEPLTIIITDMAGHVVLTRNSVTGSDITFADPLAPGMYIVQGRTAGAAWQQKLLILN